MPASGLRWLAVGAAVGLFAATIAAPLLSPHTALAVDPAPSTIEHTISVSGVGRVSLTPEPNGDRTLEVKVAQEILQTMGFRTFVPLVAACPGCGRTTSTTFQELAGSIQSFIRDSMQEWKKR